MRVLETPQVLLQLPVPLSTLVKVKVQVPLQTAALPNGHADDEDTVLPCSLNSQIISLLAATIVQQKQPGGPLIAHPCTAGHCQVFCHKVRLAISRKAVHSSSVWPTQRASQCSALSLANSDKS